MRPGATAEDGRCEQEVVHQKVPEKPGASVGASALSSAPCSPSRSLGDRASLVNEATFVLSGLAEGDVHLAAE